MSRFQTLPDYCFKCLGMNANFLDGFQEACNSAFGASEGPTLYLMVEKKKDRGPMVEGKPTACR